MSHRVEEQWDDGRRKEVRRTAQLQGIGGLAGQHCGGERGIRQERQSEEGTSHPGSGDQEGTNSTVQGD